MKLLMENWRIFLIEEEQESLQSIEPGTWSAEDLKQEYIEEIASAHRDDIVSSRWPKIKDLEKYPFLKSGKEGEKAFIEAIQSGAVKRLPLSEMKKIWNHGGVHAVIGMIEKGMTSDEIKKDRVKDFSKFETDPDASGKTHPKEESYLRWVETFEKEGSYKGTQWPPQPPILVVQDDGSYAHIGGHTRQVGALTNKKVLPYIVLSPIEEEEE